MLRALPLATVAAQRGNPDAEMRIDTADGLHQLTEALRELLGVRLPQVCTEVVPAVIQHKGVELHAALLHQLAAVGFHGVEHLLLRGVQAVVVPTVILHHGMVGHRALAVQVRQEGAAQLPLGEYALHSAEAHALTLGQRQLAVEADGRRAVLHLCLRYGQLHAAEEPCRFVDKR